MSDPFPCSLPTLIKGSKLSGKMNFLFCSRTMFDQSDNAIPPNNLTELSVVHLLRKTACSKAFDAQEVMCKEATFSP